MKPYNDLRLAEFSLYIRREAALKWAAWGLVGGLGAAALANLAARLWPMLAFWPHLALSCGLPALGTLAAFLVAFLYPRPPLSIARAADARLDLRARLATALEIEAGKVVTPSDLAARQRADAAQSATGADPRPAFKPHLQARPMLVAAILLMAVILGFALPNPQEKVIAQNQAEKEAIEKQIERLEQVRKQIAENPNLAAEDKQALLKEIDDTTQDLQNGNLSKEQAVARLSETEEKLKEQLSEDTQAQESAMEQAGQEASQGESTQETGQALQQGDYQGAAQAMESLAQELPQMSAQEQQSTAERLEAMADAVESTNPELAQAWRDAAEALRQGDTAAAQEALQRAAELTQQAGEQVAAQQATEQALAQIQEGKQQIAQSGEGDQGEKGQGEGNQGQGQQGQGQQGQGQQGQGQGQQGKDTGGGSGTGDSNGNEGGQGTPQAPDGQIDQNQPGEAGEKPYDPIYAPERLGEGEGGETIVVPKDGEGGPPTGETDNGPHDPGQALVPYDQVYTDYQAQAASALENSYIPRGMKDYVREYFSSLEPGQ